MAKSTKPKSTTSFKETAFGILPRSELIKLEAKGIKKAQQHIIKLSNKRVKISPQIILDLHKEGFGFIFPDWAGKFRKIDVTVGEYEPPYFSRVPELVQNLCDDLAERLKHLSPTQSEELFLAELISLLAWFQHRFVWIHPFNDYNGRVARLLTNLLLLNLGFPIITIKAETGKDRDKYVGAMQAADNYDSIMLESLLAQALKTSLEKV
ncbi:Fic family protein [Candidatus Daviesbacteria bacterium]|nr:Fic family protein [Candidatus Daviesbacteria bacterium]